MSTDTTWDKRQESTYIDKSDWRRGEWDEEPDKVEWKAYGFPALIVRGPSGALCGYVGVPPGHPMHDAPEPFELQLDVHGRVTYGERCAEDGHICHVPAPGESPDVYWIGFDCAHSGDYSSMAYRWEDHGPLGYETYRCVGYVRREVERLAAQLARVAKGLPATEEEEA